MSTNPIPIDIKDSPVNIGDSPVNIGDTPANTPVNVEIPNINAPNINAPNISIPELTSEAINEAMNSDKLASMFSRLADHPEDITKMMKENPIPNMTPEMNAKMSKLATSGNATQMLKHMQQKGMDPLAMRKQIKKQEQEQKDLRKANPQAHVETKKAILITTNRQTKIRDIPVALVKETAQKIIKSPDTISMSCSRLALGPLENKEIRAWYDPKHQGKNKRTSKLVGFPIGGELLLICEDGDLTEEDFITAEKLVE